jgi:hypothetical protein
LNKKIRTNLQILFLQQQFGQHPKHIRCAKKKLNIRCTPTTSCCARQSFFSLFFQLMKIAMREKIYKFSDLYIWKTSTIVRIRIVDWATTRFSAVNDNFWNLIHLILPANFSKYILLETFHPESFSSHAATHKREKNILS